MFSFNKPRKKFSFFVFILLMTFNVYFDHGTHDLVVYHSFISFDFVIFSNTVHGKLISLGQLAVRNHVSGVLFKIEPTQ